MTIALVDREVRNAIEEAVYIVLGGVREAAKLLDVSTQAVYQLLGAEVVKNRETALKIETATKGAGCEVPAAELMDLVDWTGDTRHPTGPKNGKGTRRHTKDSSPRPLRGLPDGGRADTRAAQGPAGKLQRPPKGRPSPACTPASGRRAA